MTDLILRWGDVLPGDQALDDGRLITVDDVRVLPQEGHPDFLIVHVGGYTEEGRGIGMSPPADSLTAVRRDERCPDCHMPLSMHHDPGCGEKCGKCGAAKARPVVTVTTSTGADVLAADGWQRTGQYADELAVLSGGKVIAEYRPAHWKSAVIDAHRAADGPDQAARTAELEAAIAGISVATCDNDSLMSDQLLAIRAILGRLSAAGE